MANSVDPDQTAVCFYTLFVSNARQLFAANDISRRHFQMHFYLGALRAKVVLSPCCRKRRKRAKSSYKSGNTICYMSGKDIEPAHRFQY